MTKDEVKKYADLAQIKITENEAEILTQDFVNILTHFDSIQSVDTKDAEPLYNGLHESGTLREDKVNLENLDSLIERAPEVIGRLFKVPPVV